MKSVGYETFLMLVTLLALGLGCSDDSGTGPGPVKANRVWVDMVTATTNDDYVRVNVRFANLEPLFAIEIPLYVSGSGFEIDSVSFVGSKVADVFFPTGIIDDFAQTVDLVAQADTSYIQPGEGLFASLYFTLFEQAREQVLIIDTLTLSERYLLYVDSTGDGEITPEFVAGEISVLF
ncbi:MAG: hypothetical protein KAT85_01755 [candidate division Zixibacteria bacterium]|jgi:hypothetical protein|nr:hypothetical protein [candidate division Zixibacteria bacterium]